MKKTLISRAIASLFLLALLIACEGTKTIVHDLDESEANKILVFLEGKGVKADKVKAESGGGAAGGDVKWNIVVPAGRATEAMALLNEAGLPKRVSKSLLDIFEQTGLVPSEQQEQIKFRAGLEQEIGSTIRQIDGVLDASVKLSFPKEDPLNPQAPKGKVTASVYVKHNGILDDPNSHLVSKIRNLVASSVNRLSFDDVTLIPDRARFTDSALDQRQGRAGEKELVSVWSIIIAKESTNRFRVIFFSFFIAILILILLNILLFWKIAPFLKRAGGFDKLFSPTSLVTMERARIKALKKKKAAKQKAEEQPSASEDEEEDEEDEEEE